MFDREEEQKRRNNSIAEWQGKPVAKSSQIAKQEELKDGSTLTSLLTQLGAFFTWEPTDAVKVPSPTRSLELAECSYCKKMIKLVNLMDHEEECQQQLSETAALEMMGKPRKLVSTTNPSIQRRQIRSTSPPPDEDEERRQLQDAFSKITEQPAKQLSPLKGPHFKRA